MLFLPTGHVPDPQTAASHLQTAGPGQAPSPDQAVRPVRNHRAAAQTNSDFAILEFNKESMWNDVISKFIYQYSCPVYILRNILILREIFSPNI